MEIWFRPEARTWMSSVGIRGRKVKGVWCQKGAGEKGVPRETLRTEVRTERGTTGECRNCDKDSGVSPDFYSHR